jgi:ubiquinone/menaquinone biosynthesis C-methylase UbiE
MHPNCYIELEKFLDKIPKDKPLSVVDIGAYDINGHFRNSFPKHFTYIGVDIAGGANVDIVLKDHHRWEELDGQQFDIAISANTIEHVRDIYSWFKEFSKIIKPGGYFHINAPFIHHIHRYPVDCWRILPDGMEFLVKEVAGLELTECYQSANDIITNGRKPL